jgi:hypothetical protein
MNDQEITRKTSANKSLAPTTRTLVLMRKQGINPMKDIECLKPKLSHHIYALNFLFEEITLLIENKVSIIQ